MKKYEYLLFDWDGCLAKALDIWMDSYKILFHEYKIDISERRIAQEVFGDWEGPKKVGVQDNDGFIKKLLTSVNDKYPHVQLYPNVLETLQTLKQRNKKMAMITTSSMKTIQEAIINKHIKDLFDSILTA